MKLQDDNQEESSDINITPLIDVVFLLLIFFMVSTTFSRYSELQVELPAAADSKDTEQQEQKIIDVVVNKQGNYSVNGQQLVNSQVETLRRALLDAAGDDLEIPVVLSGDGGASYQAVVAVMDAARQAGLLRLQFAHQKSEQ